MNFAPRTYILTWYNTGMPILTKPKIDINGPNFGEAKEYVIVSCRSHGVGKAAYSMRASIDNIDRLAAINKQS